MTSTRRRILIEASQLFAERGYHGTSTREIAQKVSIQQPSLYNHFHTKADILGALLDDDLVPALARITRALEIDASPAGRLHAYLRVDVAAILSLPFDVRGLYNDDVLGLPELAPQARRRQELHQATHRLVTLCVKTGELDADVDPLFIRRAVTGLLLEMVRERNETCAPAPDRRAEQVANFVLRACLAEPSSLPSICGQADHLVPKIASATGTPSDD